MNYSRQWRRTRTLSAITLHFSPHSVSNIKVMEFIYSSWLRTSLLSFSLLLSVNLWDLKKTHTVSALVAIASSFKNEYLKSARNYRTLQMYQSNHYWFVPFKKMHVKNIHLCCFGLFVLFSFFLKTTCARRVSAVGQRKCRTSVFAASSHFMK